MRVGVRGLVFCEIRGARHLGDAVRSARFAVRNMAGLCCTLLCAGRGVLSWCARHEKGGRMLL